MLTVGLGHPGAWIPAVIGVILGGLARGRLAAAELPAYRASSSGSGPLLVLGLFAGLIRTPLLNGPLSELARILFAPEGLTPIGAISTLVVVDLVVRPQAPVPDRAADRGA